MTLECQDDESSATRVDKTTHSIPLTQPVLLTFCIQFLFATRILDQFWTYAILLGIFGPEICLKPYSAKPPARYAWTNVLFVLLSQFFMPTSVSICASHRLANSSSVNLMEEILARFLTDKGSGSDRAFS